MPPSLEMLMTTEDAGRARRTLAKLTRHDLKSWALTGGIAIEMHLARAGRETTIRPLNDLDFVVPAFDLLPGTLEGDFLFRHVHPNDPPGKTLLQFIDHQTAVRVDAFRAYGSEMVRLVAVEIDGIALRMVSLEDLVARHTRLNLDLTEGRAVAAKFGRDLLRMADCVDGSRMESIWQDHRKPGMPESFATAAKLVREAIRNRPELQIVPVYSTDVREVCPRCHNVRNFPIADAGQVLALLGYC